jgi:hypothetical protein
MKTLRKAVAAIAIGTALPIGAAVLPIQAAGVLESIAFADPGCPSTFPNLEGVGVDGGGAYIICSNDLGDTLKVRL